MRHCTLGALLCGLLLGAEARADTLAAPSGVREVSHEVAVAVVDGVATYTVQRTLHNTRTTRVEEAILTLRLPHNAVAAALRVKDGAGWRDAAELGEDDARDTYEAGGAGGRIGAQLNVVEDGAQALWIGPLPPGARVTVEYTLRAQTTYRDSRHALTYPQREDARHAPIALRVTQAPSSKLWIDGAPAALNTTRTIERVVPWDTCAQLGLRHDGCLVSDLKLPARLKGQDVTFRLDVRDPKKRGLDTLIFGAPDGTYRSHSGVCGDVSTGPLTHTAQPGRWRLIAQAPSDARGVKLAWSAYDADGMKIASAPLRALPAREPPTSTHSVIEAGEQLSKRQRVEQLCERALPLVPAAEAMVFIVDASRSVGERGVHEQLRILRAYVAHTPDAEVEVIVMRRDARPLFKRFIPVSELTQALAEAEQSGAFALGAGTQPREAITLAAAQLATRAGVRDLIIFSDNPPQRRPIRHKNEQRNDAPPLTLDPALRVRVIDVPTAHDERAAGGLPIVYNGVQGWRPTDAELQSEEALLAATDAQLQPLATYETACLWDTSATSFALAGAARRPARPAPPLRREIEHDPGQRSLMQCNKSTPAPAPREAVRPVIERALHAAQARCAGAPGESIALVVLTHHDEISDVELFGEESDYAACMVKAAWSITLSPDKRWEAGTMQYFKKL